METFKQNGLQESENNKEVRLSDVEYFKFKVFCNDQEAQEFKDKWNITKIMTEDKLENSTW